MSNALWTPTKPAMACLRCGRCCTVRLPEGVGRCEYLEDVRPGETRCRVYARRFDGLPVRILFPGGQVLRSHCTKDTPREAMSTLLRGCPLEKR